MVQKKYNTNTHQSKQARVSVSVTIALIRLRFKKTKRKLQGHLSHSQSDRFRNCTNIQNWQKLPIIRVNNTYKLPKLFKLRRRRAAFITLYQIIVIYLLFKHYLDKLLINHSQVSSICITRIFLLSYNIIKLHSYFYYTYS